MSTAVFFRKGEADARFAALAGPAAVRIEPEARRFLQLKDATAAAWISVWLAGGVLQTGSGEAATAGTPARAVRLKPGAHDFLQLKDATAAQFRSLWLAAGTLQSGPAEA